MSIYETLGRIDAELALGHGAEPQRALTDLIRNMSRPVLEEWRVDLQARIDRFQPKRHLELQQLFDERTDVQPANDAGLTDAMVRERPAVAEDLYFQIDATDSNFKGALRTLGEKHIFQWATSYTQSLSHHFNCYLPLLQSELAGEAAHSIQRQLEEHTRAIFTQGYKYGQQRGLTQDILTQKSIGGLASLLDLPLDYYLQRASYSHTREETSSLRSLLSASIRGILRGYASLRLGDVDGATLLARFPNRWAYQLAFLSTDAIEDIVTQLPEGSLKVGLGTAALPLFDCLDSLMSRPRETYFPLPLFGQFSWEHRRLDVGVRSPSAWGSDRVIYARAHLAEAFVSERDLDDAAARRFAVVMAPLKPDVAHRVRTSDRFDGIVIDLGDSDRSELAERATELLARRIYKLRSKIEGARSITYNVASEFPLHTPGKSPFYHVRRTSVRNVLARFDRKNGVRLWCSVRRSGKTTACFDLDTTPGGSVIVPQTCGTEQTTNGRVFYDGVREAIETRTQLKATFVESVVRDCAPLSVDRADRTVLVIDEYETLFGHLRSVAESEPAIRYTVAQPLLNQMVEFARDNLLVLLGQQPGAHFILMDQNQLAPYVKQDPFPLFEHHLKTGEFSQLVDKVLRDQISVDTGFVDALHTETAGHPFLTVNVLCALVDWLIEQKRPARGITLDDGDFAQFQAEKLGPEQVSLGRHYDFFRETAKAAMGENSYRHNRWLYTAYWLVRQIAQADSGRFAIRRDDLPDLMEKIPAPGMLPETNEMLRTATQANFLSYTDAEVSVKVRTLGRLAASVRPALA
ncbi:hypothetical protein [Candidatus Palauibacter sp.]|uniref:hypothetical protein n=1 Tax=Candidatus Palauibacter sp. TaxID=3101350 RepID=UPI003AF2B419